MARDLFQPRDLADLAGIVARYAQKVIAEDMDGHSGVNIANMIRPMLPDIEKYAPTQAQSLRESFAEFEKSSQAVKHPSTRIYEQMQNSTIEGLFELAKNAPPEMQNNIYQNAAWRLLGEGKVEQAHQVVTEKVSNPIMRAEMLDQLERQQLIQASSTGKVDEALEQVSRLRSVEERVEMLLNIATNVFAAGDKKKGLQVLAEARSLISNRVDNYAQLSTQLQVARALLPHDADASFSIIEPLMEHLNRLIAASSVLSGFEIPEYFRRGEMVLQMGGSLTNYIQEYSQILGELARKNFDRAKSLADGFQLHEIRAMVYISMAVNLLKDDEEESSPGEGVEGMSRLDVRIRQK